MILTNSLIGFLAIALFYVYRLKPYSWQDIRSFSFLTHLGQPFFLSVVAQLIITFLIWLQPELTTEIIGWIGIEPGEVNASPFIVGIAIAGLFYSDKSK